MASTTLYRAASTATGATKYTLSMWIKRSNISVEQTLIGVESGTTVEIIKFNADDKLYWYNRDAAGNAAESSTTQVFRDLSAYYNLVFSYDSTQASAADQKKIYVNGVATTWGSEAAIQSNAVPGMNLSGATRYIGREGAGTSYYYDGLISYVSFIDGTVYDQSYFGSTQAASGIWQIKTSPAVTYGNNGFFLKMDTSSPGTDTSGNNNTFTATGTPTLTQDNPSNNFPTINKTMQPMDYSNATLSDGATSSNSSGGDYTLVCSMGANKGKWYWEVKLGNASNTRNIGVVRSDQLRISGNSGGFYPGGNGNATNFTSAWNGSTGFVQTNTAGTQVQVTSGVTNTTTGDIVGVALDLDGYTLKFYKNGTLDGTAALSSAWVENFVLPCARADSGQTMYFNFGNGFFSTTAVTSSNADAAGYGLFEYAVPTGYYTLCTKNLNTYG
tara:strand:- start:1692 stop:3020 length:1329 start_codon:yes stop_codon:yes gene_type:complete